MNDELHEERRAYRLAKNRFVVMLASSIAVALLLVTIAMILYTTSGTAQLDLSRPGYTDVRDKINSDLGLSTFPSTGEINKEAIASFEKLYDETAKQATSINAFEDGVLSDEALRINDNPAATANQ